MARFQASSAGTPDRDAPWHNSRMLCFGRNPDPFELVTVNRERDASGQVTAWYVIEGSQLGGSRSRRIHHDVLRNQAEAHLQIQHGKSITDTVTPVEWSHAIRHAAIAFLMD